MRLYGCFAKREGQKGSNVKRMRRKYAKNILDKRSSRIPLQTRLSFRHVLDTEAIPEALSLVQLILSPRFEFPQGSLVKSCSRG